MHSLVYSSITVSNLTARPSSVLHVTLHSKLVAQPPGSTHIMAADSGHGIQIDRPSSPGPFDRLLTRPATRSITIGVSLSVHGRRCSCVPHEYTRP